MVVLDERHPSKILLVNDPIRIHFVGSCTEKDEQGGKISVSEGREGGQREVPGSNGCKTEKGNSFLVVLPHS